MEYSDDYINKICNTVDEMVATFGFDTSGVTGASLGNDAVNAVAESISEDCRNGTAPDGSTWAANKDPYAAWKARVKGIHDPGYLTGETLSLKALVGTVVVTNDSVTMTHGTGATDATGATDKKKGAWLTVGGGKGGTPRPFYSLNDKRNALVVAVMAEGLSRHVDAKAGGV